MLAREQDPDVVDPSLMAAIGYGFGGDTVMEMVRAGSNISGVVAVHPTTLQPAAPRNASFDSRILVLLGDLQTNIASSDVFEFEDELRTLVRDWEVSWESFLIPYASDETSFGRKGAACGYFLCT